MSKSTVKKETRGRPREYDKEMTNKDYRAARVERFRKLGGFTVSLDIDEVNLINAFSQHLKETGKTKGKAVKDILYDYFDITPSES